MTTGLEYGDGRIIGSFESTSTSVQYASSMYFYEIYSHRLRNYSRIVDLDLRTYVPDSPLGQRESRLLLRA